MNRLKLEIKAAFDGQPSIASGDPEVLKVLDELRGLVGKPAEQRLLGIFVMEMISARLKSGFKTERAIKNAIGARGNDACKP